MSLYQERLDRTKAAIALEPVDRVPVSYLGTAVNAQFTGVKLSDYCSDMELNCTTNLKGIEMVGEIDSTQGMIFEPNLLAGVWLTEVLIPGQKGVDDNELWQMHEREIVTQDDYDKILEDGFTPWYQQFLVEKFENPLAKSQGYFEYMPTAVKRFRDAGIPSINDGSLYSPFEMFCGGRSLMAFFMEDLMEIPDKVEAVFDLAQAENLKAFEMQLSNPDAKPTGVWIGGWRGTPEMLSPEMFERFSWKYIKELVELTLAHDVIPLLHLDSCWDLGLEYFKELPKKKCIMSLDGKTDIFKAKEVIGDHMCIMGDVPSQMLALSTPDVVTEYCTRLIKEVGPTGFILNSGCDIPYNAKLENVQAMVNSVKL